MFRASSITALPTYKLVVGLGLCTLGGAMLYAYFKIRDDEDNADSEKQDVQSKQKHIKPNKRERADVETSVTFEVSNSNIPLMVGRNGVNLKKIEEITRTKIRFRDKDDSTKYCDISGLPSAVKQAQAILLKEAERSPIVTEEIFVPQQCCGKVVGRCGESIKEICRISQAKISVDGGGRNGGAEKRRVIIVGNRQQVNIARKLLEDYIEQDENLRRSITNIEQNREHRRSPTNSVNSSLYSSQTSLTSHVIPREKLITSTSEEKTMEVFVSAIASPSKFWVQLVGPQSEKLDQMVKDMTEYYNVEENREKHKIDKPYFGQIVAAVFKYDGKWYRTEVVGILPNKYNPNETLLDLYFVDYGDSEYVAPHEVYELRTDFLTLRFQAIECFLANVKAVRESSQNTWDMQSIQVFEELTGVATWKKLISRVVTYKERPKDSKYLDENSGSSREGSPIPGVELFDLIEGYEVNIGQYMISEGFAVQNDGSGLKTLRNGDSSLTLNNQNDANANANVSDNLSDKMNTSSSAEEAVEDADVAKDVVQETAEDIAIKNQLDHLAEKHSFINGNHKNASNAQQQHVLAKNDNKKDFLNNFKNNEISTSEQQYSNEL